MSLSKQTKEGIRLTGILILVIMVLYLFTAHTEPSITGLLIVESGSAINGTVEFDKQLIPIGTVVAIDVGHQHYEKNIVSYLGDPYEIIYQNTTVYGYDVALSVDLSSYAITLEPEKYTLTIRLVYDGTVLNTRSIAVGVYASPTPQNATNTTISSPTLDQPATPAPSSISEPISMQAEDEPIPPSDSKGVGVQVSISTCGNLTNQNVYQLTANVSASALACFTILGHNITLDCQGFSIVYGNQTAVGANYGINATNVNNFTLQSCNIIKNNGSFAQGFGIYFHGVTNSTIKNVTVITNGTNQNYGILINSSSNNSIENSSVYTFGSGAQNDGVYIAAASTRNRMAQNFISTNGTSGTNRGVLITGSSDNNSIENTDIRTNGNGAANTGIFINASINNSITNATIVTNGTLSAVGIHIQENSNRTRIRNSTTSTQGNGGSNVGIRFDYSANNSIIDTFVTTNGTSDNYGIYLNVTAMYLTGSADGTVIKNNTVRTDGSLNNNYGIYFLQSMNVTIANNSIMTNGTTDNYGMYFFRNGSNLIILNNTLYTRGTTNNYGMYLSAFSANNFIRENIISTNGSGDNYGIFIIVNSSNNTLKTNIISTNGGATNNGIYITGSVNTSIRDNTIRTNGTTDNKGIHLVNESNGSFITNNTITTQGSGSRNRAIRIDVSDNITVLDNNLRTNGTTDNTGIYLNATTRYSLILNNTINVRGSGNLNIGIFAWAMHNSTIGNNTVFTNGTDNNFGIGVGNRSNNVTVHNNTITTNGSSSDNLGLVINFSDNVTAASNVIRTNGTNTNYGLLINEQSNDNGLMNNTITSGGSGQSNYGIFIRTTSLNNTVVGNTVNTEGTSDNEGITLSGVINNTHVESNVVTTSGSQIQNIGIFLVNNASSNIVMLNRVTTACAASVGGLSTCSGMNIHNDSNNNTIRNNTITTQGQGGGNIGMDVFNRARNNTIGNNTINTGGTLANYGILLNNNGSNNTIRNNTIRTNGSGAINYGVIMRSSVNNTIIENTIRTNGTQQDHGVVFEVGANSNLLHNNSILGAGTDAASVGILVNNSDNNTISENNFSARGTALSDGLNIAGTSNNTIIINNNITSDGGLTVSDNTTSNSTNYFMYNNSFGQIRWTDGEANGFLLNLTFNMSGIEGIGIGRNIYILNNTIAFNGSALQFGRINSSANVTINNFSLPTNAITLFRIEGFSNSVRDVLENGTNCNATSCRALSYNNTTQVLIFNTTSFSSFATDSLPPSVFNVLPTNATTYNVSVTINISANVTDAGDVDNVRANISQPNGSSTMLTLTQATGTPIYNASYTLSNFTGNHNISFLVNDTSGNTNNSESTLIISVDRIIPTIDLASCANTSMNTGGTTQCNATIREHTNISGTFANVTLPNGTIITQTLSNNSRNYYFSFTNTQKNGTYNVTWMANDTQGNTNNTRAIDTFTINDTIPPSAFAINPTNATNYNVSVTINISINVTDLNGTVDTVLANVSQPNSSSTLVTLTQAAGTPIYNASYTLSNFTGNHNITILANDTNGNVNTSQSTIVISVDRIMPTIDLTGCENTTMNTGGTTTCNATIREHTNISTVVANVTIPNNTIINPAISNNSRNYYFSFTNTQKNGTYNVTWMANDTQNNINNSRLSDTFTVNDTIPPSTFAIRPTNATNYNVSVTINISINVTDLNGTVGTVLANVSQPNSSSTLITLTQASGTPIYNGSYALSNFTGNHNITIIANDTNGNTNNSQSTIIISVDQIPPEIRSQTCTPTNNTGQGINCNTLVYDHTNHSSIQANVTLPNGTIITQTVTNTSNNYTFHYTNTQKNGTYDVTWMANDTQNNINNTRTIITFTVNDTVFPSVDALVPSNSSLYNETSVIQLAANVSDLNGTVDTVIANVSQPNSSSTSVVLSQAGGTRIYNNTYTVPPISGNYNITIIANDTNANTNSSRTTLFITDAEQPIVDMNTPANDSTNPNTTITFGWGVRDDIDTNITCNFSINNTIIQSGIGVANNTNYTTTVAGIRTGFQNWSLNCTDNVNSTNTSARVFTVQVPASVEFSNHTESTNFTNGTNITDVLNPVIANNAGLIRFRGTVNASTRNLDKDVEIGSNFIAVNTSSLTDNWNITANITLYNVSCPVTHIAVRQGFYTSRQDIQMNGTDCFANGICTNIVCAASTLNFTVRGFSGFASEGNANLTITNTGSTVSGRPITFNASYINASSGVVINNSVGAASCNLTFAPISGALNASMAFNTATRIYEHTTTIPQFGTFRYNVTCGANDYTTLVANDTITSTQSTPNDPGSGSGGTFESGTGGGGGGGSGGGGKSEPAYAPTIQPPPSNPPQYETDFPQPSGAELIQEENQQSVTEIPPEHSQQIEEKESSGTATSIRKAQSMAWNAITSLANGIASSLKKLTYTGKAVSQPITKLSPNTKLSVLAIAILLNLFVGLLIWDIRRLKKQQKETMQEQDVERLLRKLDQESMKDSVSNEKKRWLK